MNTLGNNIKYLRKQQKLSQQKLGDLIGASQTSVAHYELGTREPSLETLIKLSSLFNESVDYLLGNQVYGSTPRTKKEEKKDISSLLLNALLEKDDRLFLDLFLNHVLGVYELSHIMDVILKELLYDVGSMWNQGNINEADEHYATNQIRKAINYISVLNMNKLKIKSAVTFSVGSETHTLGIEMVNTYLETLGVKSIYLGTNLPFRSIENVIKDYQPNYVFISITLFNQINTLTQLIEYLNTRFEEPLQIVIGGQGYEESNALKQFSNVHFIKTMQDLKTFVY
jgi:methanogenic corrinoid protein MtbC1